MTNANSTLSLDQITLIKSVDQLSQATCGTIADFADEIAAITDDAAIKLLVAYIKEAAESLENDVNVMAEALGANHTRH